MFKNCFAGKRVLVTGSTGFKGSWLTLWLQALGAEVTGYSLDPDTKPSHWELLELQVDHVSADVRNDQMLRSVIEKTSPHLIFHLAAQPLVRASYSDPVQTWSTNVMGTVNLLNACRGVSSLLGIVVITTDKVYDNPENGVPFSEREPLGAGDPYSSSKAACELVVESFSRGFFTGNTPIIASCRAGNVIGGGDWAKDRLIPDIVKSMIIGTRLDIRYPRAVRPWQHVLDSLSGYLCLAQRMVEGDKTVQGAWNFGPRLVDNYSVENMLTAMRTFWPELTWNRSQSKALHEATLLRLNCEKAQSQLHWQPVWDFSNTARQTAVWYQNYYANGHVSSFEQLKQYQQDAHEKGVFWACN
ncbi:CDP-glucose 4,6-dehydratase [Alteromonas profundi]|nr:CDP-glucose 4,6-dehydratase [Alteromonas profundi]